MNLTPRKRYTPEFKAQAVELLSTGKPVSQVAEELCISSDLLYRWRHSAQVAQVAQLSSAGARAAGERSEADELRALRREITLLRLENDILKKAAVILGTRLPANCGK